MRIQLIRISAFLFHVKNIAARALRVLIAATLLWSCGGGEGEVQAGKSGAGALEAGVRLGDAGMDVRGTEEAREAFHCGLLLLHSFEYGDAAEAFRAAQRADSSVAMAYWGEAMTYNHPLWRGQDADAARAVLARLGATKEERQARCDDEVQRGLMEAVGILYGEGDKHERDLAYRDRMAALHERFPEDQEVAAFYALSILGAVAVGRDDEAYERSARVAASVLDENPRHPGALHYTIHSYDDPFHAHLARGAADRYAEVAPDAAHALHMPSHIYVALGDWEAVVKSNIASWEASVARQREKGLDQDAVSYHALHWLLYGYLQLGLRDRADSLMRDMAGYVELKPSIQAREYYIRMIGNYLVETGDWGHPIASTEVSTDSLNILLQSSYRFIAGMRDLAAGQVLFAELTLDGMRRDRERAALFVDDRGLPMCSAGGVVRLPNRLDIEQSRVMELQLRAALADIRGEAGKAEAYLQEAVALEEGLSYAYGPPAVLWPSFEQYGEWLIKEGRRGEAVAQFETALKRGPGRKRALMGMAKAR